MTCGIGVAVKLGAYKETFSPNILLVSPLTEGKMTIRQRVIAISVAGALLLAGFAFGRVSDPPKTTAAEENKSALTTPVNPAQNTTPEAAKEDQAFFLSDFKTGYTEGYSAGVAGQTANTVNTNRAGYNDGFKQGFADGYKSRLNPQATQTVVTSTGTRLASRPVVYRSAPERKRNSTLKKVLTIAAPAAIGAGIGGAVGGGKGAGVGALLGGGGGALYTLIKDRNK
jgi:hypothetical protein